MSFPDYLEIHRSENNTGDFGREGGGTFEAHRRPQPRPGPSGHVEANSSGGVIPEPVRPQTDRKRDLIKVWLKR